ncbi:MAG: Preprotein translocase subunit [Pseudonocardiales bacterium]|jgi:preprotein translocase subunit YajC|nr:Preprotein translocase subunit [Pseudonocardiales bacterium]
MSIRKWFVAVTQVLPLVILAVLFIGMIMFNRRNRARSAQADRVRRENMRPGTEVMTTSGLYATVVSVNTADSSAVLSIASGVEVKWTIAALRAVPELPPQYRDAVLSGEAPIREDAVARDDRPGSRSDETEGN